jgi:hypothetical protein
MSNEIMNLLPECMLPDGGEACKAYLELYEKHHTLRNEIYELKDLIRKQESIINEGSFTTKGKILLRALPEIKTPCRSQQ